MSFLDLIHEMRTKEAKPEKAARAMKILALMCLLGGIWNSAFVFLAPLNEMPVKIDPDFPLTALVVGTLLAALFYQASRGIAERMAWGKRLGQASVVLFLAAIVAGIVSFLAGIPADLPIPPPLLIVFSVIFIAQFGVPALFGISYLGRLPVDENRFVRPQAGPERVMRAPFSGQSAGTPTPVETYKEAVVPFGVVGTFAIMLASLIVGMLALEKVASPAVLSFLFFFGFFAIFLGPVLYNRKRSGFELGRTVVASYTGGGSMFLFNGTWPNFRLLVYNDGVEVRVMFHRFFIPYDKMEDLPDKIRFFGRRGVLFRSDLPGVPSSIRFYGFSTKRILEFVTDRRNRYLVLQAGAMKS